MAVMVFHVTQYPTDQGVSADQGGPDNGQNIRQVVLPVVRSCVGHSSGGVVTEYIHPLYTEWCIEATSAFQCVEYGHRLQ
jgi:hypothetical protein